MQGIELDRAEAELAHEAARTGEAAQERKYVVIGGTRRSLRYFGNAACQRPCRLCDRCDGEDNALQELMRHIAAHGDTLNKLATAVAIFGPDQKLKYFNQAYAQSVAPG